jgi:hypothetical protein
MCPNKGDFTFVTFFTFLPFFSLFVTFFYFCNFFFTSSHLLHQLSLSSYVCLLPAPPLTSWQLTGLTQAILTSVCHIHSLLFTLIHLQAHQLFLSVCLLLSSHSPSSHIWSNWIYCSDLSLFFLCLSESCSFTSPTSFVNFQVLQLHSDLGSCFVTCEPTF